MSLRPLERDALDRRRGLRSPGEHCVPRLRRSRHRTARTTTTAATSAARSGATRAGGLVFEIEANRFLHHMVRFLVGTMIDVAQGRRPLADIDALLGATDNDEVSAPAPPHALFLDRVRYPADLYLPDGMKIFLATASTDDVAWGAAHGMLDGVLTTPGLLADDGEQRCRARTWPSCAASCTGRSSPP